MDTSVTITEMMRAMGEKARAAAEVLAFASQERKYAALIRHA